MKEKVHYAINVPLAWANKTIDSRYYRHTGLSKLYVTGGFFEEMSQNNPICISLGIGGDEPAWRSFVPNY